MSQWSSYLPSIAQGDRVPSNYVPELSRRARGIPVWALIRHFGRQGIADMVERHCGLARRFAELLAAEPGVRVVNDVVLNQVIVNFGTGDAAARKAATEAVIAKTLASGTCYVAGAAWRGDWVMRLSVTSGETTEADIDAQRRRHHRRLARGSGGLKPERLGQQPVGPQPHVVVPRGGGHHHLVGAGLGDLRLDLALHRLRRADDPELALVLDDPLLVVGIDVPRRLFGRRPACGSRPTWNNAHISCCDRARNCASSSVGATSADSAMIACGFGNASVGVCDAR